jgi:Rieske [2Fe-2S] domain
MSEWKAVCLVTDIPVLGARRVARDAGLPVAVFRNDQDQVFALLDRCPHKGGPLSQGIVLGDSVASSSLTAAPKRRMWAARRASPARWKAARCSWTPPNWPATPPSWPRRWPARRPRPVPETAHGHG